MSWDGPRTFRKGVTYVSHSKDFYTGNDEEFLFYVLGPSDKYWNKWMGSAIQYWAINLYTGEKFEFHRDSVIAQDARELFE